MPLPSYASPTDVIGAALVTDALALFPGKSPFTVLFGPVDKSETLLYPLWRFMPGQQTVSREGQTLADTHLFHLVVEYLPGQDQSPAILARAAYVAMIQDLELWLNHWGSKAKISLGGAVSQIGKKISVNHGLGPYMSDLGRSVIGCGVQFTILALPRPIGP